MILAPSQRFSRALLASHERHLRITLHLWDEQGVLRPVGPVQVVNAMLSLDSSLASWRRLSGDAVLPKVTADAIGGVNTFNGEVSVEVGIGFAAGIDWVQIAQLRIEESTRISGRVPRPFTAFDRAIRVADFPFITPYAPRDMAGNQLSVVGGIVDIITTAFPSNSPPTFVIDPTLDTGLLPPAETSFTGARWDAVLKLAQSIGATVHNDRLGRFVIRPLASSSDPSLTLMGGPGGTLVQHGVASTRVDQFNAVGLTSESPAGDGIFVYVVDNDRNSPTYYDGPFGRKPFLTRNDTITTVESCIAAARALLARKRSGARDLDLSAVYNPLLEPMDTVEVLDPQGGAPEKQVVDSIDLPLTGGQMSLKTHLWMLPAEVRLAIRNGKKVIG